MTREPAPDSGEDQDAAEEAETFTSPAQSPHQECLDRVSDDGREPLYVVEAEHEGEPAIVVAAASGSDPDLVWLYTFPGRDCSAEPQVTQGPLPD